MPLTKSQFAPYDLYDNLTLESFVRGLATQKAQVRTRHKHIVATDVYSGNGCRHVSRTDRPPLPARRWKVWSWFGKRKLAEDTMIHMLSSDFHLSRLASTSKEVEIMVLHHTQGWHIHQGCKLINFFFVWPAGGNYVGYLRWSLGKCSPRSSPRILCQDCRPFMIRWVAGPTNY